MHHGMGGGCPVCGGGMGQGSCGCGKGLGGIKAMFMKMPWMVIMHAEELGLSEEQVEKLRKRHSEALKQIIGIKSQMKMDMIDVKDAVMREEIDMPTAEAKIREIGKLKADMFLAIIHAIHDMRQIATPEQRAKIKAMMMGWMQKGGMAGFGGEEEQEGEGESEE
jgi:Spy/CpxP family protein refolding chaperone